MSSLLWHTNYVKPIMTHQLRQVYFDTPTTQAYCDSLFDTPTMSGLLWHTNYVKHIVNIMRSIMMHLI